jgi:hypothetical protein
MRGSLKTAGSWLVVLDRQVLFTAGGTERLIDVPWVYHVVKMDGRLRFRENMRAAGENQLAECDSFITTPPCAGK